MAETVELVGIVNPTPDSFSDGGEYFSPDKAVAHAHELFNDGATYVDIGAESTRPDATPITLEEEWRRLEPVLRELVPAYTGHIMLDSFHPETVRRVFAEIGTVIINDVTGMNNPAMVEAAAELQTPVVVSHLPGISGTDIQASHRSKPVDSVEQVVEELYQRVEALEKAGIDRSFITLDPGFGFGKDPRINKDLLGLPRLMEDMPGFMLGVSRKSSLKKRDFCGESLADFDSMGEKPMTAWLDERSVEIGLEGAANGFTMLRVHNVALHAAALGIWY